jgi:tRNA-splicing ligase RtcB
MRLFATLPRQRQVRSWKRRLRSIFRVWSMLPGIVQASYPMQDAHWAMAFHFAPSANRFSSAAAWARAPTFWPAPRRPSRRRSLRLATGQAAPCRAMRRSSSGAAAQSRMTWPRRILVRSPSIRGIAEEAPRAYKDVDAVVLAAARAGLVRRVARLRPLICIKGWRRRQPFLRVAQAGDPPLLNRSMSEG